MLIRFRIQAQTSDLRYAITVTALVTITSHSILVNILRLRADSLLSCFSHELLTQSQFASIVVFEGRCYLLLWGPSHCLP